MTEMVTSGSMSGAEKRSDGLLGESASERPRLVLGAAGPGRHRASPRLYRWEGRGCASGASSLEVVGQGDPFDDDLDGARDLQ